MKNVLLAMLFVGALLSCSGDSESIPLIGKDPNAPVVSLIQAIDIGNNGNGSDLQISFNKVSNEKFISEYRIFVVRKSVQSSFSLEVAESVPGDSYTSVSLDNSNKKVALSETSKDTDGQLIVESVEYIAFVMSVADGENATLNALSSPSNTISLEQKVKPTATWSVEELSIELVGLASNYLEFMEESSMMGTYLELNDQDVDDRPNNNLDEVYYIYGGTGTLSFNGTDIDVQEGKVIFTKAGANARFTQITTPLQVVIVAMKTASNASSPASDVFSKSMMESPRNPNSNVWNPFIQLSNLILGLYMLPETGGGDGRLVHSWQELNIVTSGDCIFEKDDEEIQVKRGSIFFVNAGNGHFFRSLSSDTDILILWQQP